MRDESGSLVVFTLILFVLMAMMGGIAVDLMRYEATRVTLQQTIDRATLAAASLDQLLDPEDVVRDYFAKAGMSDKLEDVVIDEGINYRNVTASAKAISQNYFMQMIGINQIDAPGESIAEQRITNVEIALVLDVSGSMVNTPSRITNLKSSAKEFVDAVLAKDVQNKISISIVPYNGQVNLGPDLFSKYTVTNQTGLAQHYCVDLPTSTYSSTSLSRTTAFPQVPFVDAFTTTTQSTSYVSLQGPTVNASGQYSNMWCQLGSGNYVRPHNNDKIVIKNQIDGLFGVGATSIDLGMKWGVTMLDPGTRTVISGLVLSNIVPTYFSGRPANYGDPETMKVVVLMTDGEHFEAERFKDGFRTGATSAAVSGAGTATPIYRSTDGSFSIFHASKVVTTTTTTICNSRPYWIPHRSEWASRPWTGTAPSSSACYVPATTTFTGATLQTWQQVWAVARTQWVAWQLYARALGTSSTTRTNTFNTWMANFRDLTATDTMDNRLDQICEAAKTNGIVVYGIALEAPNHGQDVIKDCASSPSATYFFNVDSEGRGLTIRTAFRLIASNISQLRLTQ